MNSTAHGVCGTARKLLPSMFFPVLISYAEPIAIDQPDAACSKILNGVKTASWAPGVKFGDLEDHDALNYLDK